MYLLWYYIYIYIDNACKNTSYNQNWTVHLRFDGSTRNIWGVKSLRSKGRIWVNIKCCRDHFRVDLRRRTSQNIFQMWRIARYFVDFNDVLSSPHIWCPWWAIQVVERCWLHHLKLLPASGTFVKTWNANLRGSLQMVRYTYRKLTIICQSFRFHFLSLPSKY